jgi:hypothetical protein
MEFEYATVAVHVPADPASVARDLADPRTHPEWGTEFFAGPARARPDGAVDVEVPRLGGPARFRVDADPDRGVLDLYLAPSGAPYGPPLPVRVLPAGSGSDVLFTLKRPDQADDDAWREALASMGRELQALRRRFATE